MLKRLFAPRFLTLYTFLASVLFVHFRGQKRWKFWKQLSDHSSLFAPYNALVTLFSSAPTTPTLDAREFPDLAPLQDNWETIREEALKLWEGGYITAAASKNDLAFNTFFKNGWKRFYLKWYDDTMPSARELCPKTVELIEKIPSVHAALFVNLQPKSKLGEHRDPFGGSLRYHLGLKTPNSDECRIFIDGKLHSWRDGEALMFDETFIHRAENKTDQDRIILFCDIERPIGNPAVRSLNHWVATHIVKESAAQNLPTEKVGLINQVSAYIQQYKEASSRLKKKNKKVYYWVKNTVLVLVGGRMLIGAAKFVKGDK